MPSMIIEFLHYAANTLVCGLTSRVYECPSGRRTLSRINGQNDWLNICQKQEILNMKWGFWCYGGGF